MRTAYVEVGLEGEQPSFVVSSVPFLYRNGFLLMPAGRKTYEAQSYSELCAILRAEFLIPQAMLPPAKCFRPTKAERDNEEWKIYRTVPEGAGEPEWRTKARQAVIDALDAASESMSPGEGKAVVGDKVCHSIEEINAELISIAEKAGGRKRIAGEAYPPNYDVLVRETLDRDTFLLQHSGLPQKSRTRSG